MTSVQIDFRTRAEEVHRYFGFLHAYDKNRIVFLERSADVPAMTSADQIGLFKTLKANGFLLLYNLVESTVRNAIEAIFDEFKSRGVPFDDCTDAVRKIILTNLKRHNVDSILPSLSAISVDVVVATFRKEELFAGNVDARRIREVAADYGIRQPLKKSDSLLTVKTNRNDLAHGTKSFADVGRDYGVEQLAEIKDEIVAFLDELLENVAIYIRTRAYLSTA